MTSLTILKQLNSLGLSTQQSEIYLLLAKHKQLRVSQITKLTQIPRSSVYEILRTLFKLGLAEEIVLESYKVIKAYPITTLRHSLEEQISKTQKLRDNLRGLEKQISRSNSQIKYPPTIVRYYKDRSGARQLFWNSLKATNTIYVFSEWGRGRYVGMSFYESFVAESKTRNIQERVIINPTKHAISSIKKYTNTPISRTKIDSIRAISQNQINIKGDALMYDNIFAQVYLKTSEINGFEIESKLFVDTQRAVHETLWEIATPIKGFLN